MTKQNKNIFCFLVLVVLCIVVAVCVNCFRRPEFSIRVDDSVSGIIRPYALSLANEVNKSGVLDRDYTLYVANFEKGQSVPEIKTKHNILWLGSTRGALPLPDWSKFDYILASTPLFKDFLSGDLKDKVYYLPCFDNAGDISKKEDKFIAIIGNPPFAEDIIQEKSLPYRVYSINDGERILRDMPKFQAVIALGSALNDMSLDLNPIFYTVAAQKIPIATWWGWMNSVEDALNLFNDRIYFYMGKSDLERFIVDVSKKTLPHEIVNKINDAKKLVENEYSLKSSAEKLAHILKYGREPEIKADEKSLNFDLPVAVGHTGSGDYWLISDLASYLSDYSWHTSMTFFNSLYRYPAKVNILIRGMKPNPRDVFGEINILYLAYPQIGDGNEDNIDSANYFRDFLKDVEMYDAVVSASKDLSAKLTELGVRSYYVPQFTNPKRFYPDFHKELQTDVLFVGMNAFYRRAAHIVLKHKLPITIYGPGWEGAEKEGFLDNRELYKHYSSAKIVLNDSRKEMLALGVISNRIFDATACETLVISDYISEIEEIYGDSVPMWKTEEELVNLVKYYLDPAHEEERKEKAKRAREITLKNFTADIVAKKFFEIIDEVKKERVKR